MPLRRQERRGSMPFPQRCGPCARKHPQVQTSGVCSRGWSFAPRDTGCLASERASTQRSQSADHCLIDHFAWSPASFRPKKNVRSAGPRRDKKWSTNLSHERGLAPRPTKLPPAGSTWCTDQARRARCHKGNPPPLCSVKRPARGRDIRSRSEPPHHCDREVPQL